MKQSEGGGGDFQPVHQWMRAGATCVASPRDSSAATAHVCLGSNRGSLSPSPPPSSFRKKQPYTGYLVLLPWRWGVLVIGAHAVTAEKPRASCHLNWGRKDTIIFSSNRLASCVLAVKNSRPQTPCLSNIIMGCG